jgi:hypothetical protein
VLAYGDPVRWRLVLPSFVALVALVALVGCSGASGSSGNGGAKVGERQVLCPLVARLDRSGADVARVDVKDPGAFDNALGAAVKRYIATLDALRDVVPRDLRDDLERLRAAVEQYRFGDGVEAHAALDTYAKGICT